MSASGVLYTICCAAPPAQRARVLVERAKARGFDVCLILTPTAARWLDSELGDLAELTGHPVRSSYKLPSEPDVLPPPDAMLVAPATFTTLNKWALGIADTLALGLLTEGMGTRLPQVAMACLNDAQSAHPAFARSIGVLRDAGVHVMLGVGGQAAHSPEIRSPDGGPDPYPWNLGLDALGKLIRRRSAP